MDDDKIEEIGVKFRGDRTLLRWRYPNGPNFYRWFPQDYP